MAPLLLQRPPHCRRHRLSRRRAAPPHAAALPWLHAGACTSESLWPGPSLSPSLSLSLELGQCTRGLHRLTRAELCTHTSFTDALVTCVHLVHRALEARLKEDLVVVVAVVHHVQSLPIELCAVCLQTQQHRFTSRWHLIPHGDGGF
jgi:hypothetical protein